MSVPGRLLRIDVTGVQILESLGQHRLLSTRQIHELHAPEATRQWTRHLLGRLRAAGLARSVTGLDGVGLWFVTASGADALEEIPSRAETRRPAVTEAKATGPLQHHTLGVNDVGLAFVRAARGRAGDECGPFDWFHEVALPLGPPPGRRAPEQLIADAVLTYALRGRSSGAFRIAYRFVELDRANRSAAELARRIGRYARLYRHEVRTEDGRRVPVWERYPVFPKLVVVLAGRPDERLADRRAKVLALCGDDPELVGTPQVRVSICLFDELLTIGPFGSIFRDPIDPDSDIDWLGDAP